MASGVHWEMPNSAPGEEAPTMISRPLATFVRLAMTSSALALLAVGCASETGDEELWDEGAPPEDSDLGTQEQVGTVSEALSIANFQLPFPCGQVWSGQTRRNHSPVNSIDFNRSGDQGDTVVAAAAGTVRRVQHLGSRSYGLWVEIDHGSGYTTRYAHLSSHAVFVGKRVGRGERIGAVGNTGGSSGAHLHFEIRRNGADARIAFDGAPALYFGTRSYTSKNCPGGASGGGGTGAGVTGRVETSGAPVNVRAGAGTGFAIVGSAADGASVRITCQRRGTTVSGPFGRTDLWDKTGSGYVSDAYVYTGSDGRVAPDCP